MGERKPWKLAAGKGWERFEEASYEYARECTFKELEKEGYVGPRGDLLWASEYMPAFFDSLDEEILKEVLNSGGDYVLQEAQYRFIVAFREGWQAASGASTKESANRWVSENASTR